MAFELKFWEDAGMLIESTQLNVQVGVDGTGNPAQAVRYLGSNTSTILWRAKSNPGVDTIYCTPTYKIGVWAASTVITLNTEIMATVDNTYKYRAVGVVGTGLTGASEPTWPLAETGQVVDNEVTWENVGLHHTPSEFKLATTQGGLASAVAGDPLSLGVVLNGGTAYPIWIEIYDPNLEENDPDIDIQLVITEVQQENV